MVDQAGRVKAIVAIDVVGHNRLMHGVEVGMLKRMNQARAILDPILHARGGRIFNSTGDGLLAEFLSVVAAVYFALEMQAEMAAFNGETAPDEQVLLRVGINLGDVLGDGDDLFGNGVNVATRLEALAKPGAVCISRSVYDQVRDRIDAKFEGLGEIRMKNIARPVHAFRVTAASKAIAELDAGYSAKPPLQKPAIIRVEYREDGKLHRDASMPPEARDGAQEQRLREAWSAHSEQLAALEDLAPGRNSPALGHAIKCYRDALGLAYDHMNVIALGVHGARLTAFAERADVLLLEDAASELVGLAAAHGLFIRQFDVWHDYLNDAADDAPPEAVDAAIQIARSTRDATDIIADDVSEPLNDLADAAGQPLAANPEDRQPAVVDRELLRSVGNVLSGLFAPLVAYARDAGSASRTGSLDGIKEFSKQATLALVFGGTAYVAALAAGLPTEFGWLVPVLALLKMKLKK